MQTNQQTKNVSRDTLDHYLAIRQLSGQCMRSKITVLPEVNQNYGAEMSLDLMFLDGQEVFHAVDTATRFSAATFSNALDS